MMQHRYQLFCGNYNIGILNCFHYLRISYPLMHHNERIRLFSVNVRIFTQASGRCVLWIS